MKDLEKDKGLENEELREGGGVSKCMERLVVEWRGWWIGG